MASLSDISRRAGVSIATASRVLNGSAHPVSENTRTRVLQAAEELGYEVTSFPTATGAARAAVAEAGVDGRVLVTGSLYLLADLSRNGG